MNSERLLELYDRVADAPDAVERLRRFVLDLAVRGKLVEQEEGDESATSLLDQIKSKRNDLFKSGQIKKPKKFPPIDEAPFEVPANWEWARIREITSDRGQKVPDQTFTYIDVSAIDKEAGIVADPKILTKDDAPSRARKIASTGDVIYSCVRPYLLNVAVIDKEFEPAPIVSTAFAVLDGHGLVLPWYLWIALRSPFMIEQVEGNQRGQAYPAINDKDFSQLPFPLPPLPEQHRIVAKVDELMALLDRLETIRTKRETTRDRLTNASLGRLTAADTAEKDFPGFARFALENLDELTRRSDQIKVLRQTILDLAVRGKLVEQDSTDGYAEEAVHQIGRRKEEMVRNGQLRREKPLKPVGQDDVPFEIPHNWKWVRIGDLALFTQYGTSAKAAPTESGIPVLTMGNIQDGSVIRTNEKRIPESSDELPALYLKKFDLLYNRTNSAELVGKTGLYQGDDDCLTFASYLIRIRLSADDTSPVYINLAMNTPHFRTTQIMPHIKKQTGQANVSGSALKNMLIPLPPVAEQHRIVRTIRTLMGLCDKLEAVETTGDNTRARFLEFLLHDSLAQDARSRDAA